MEKIMVDEISTLQLYEKLQQNEAVFLLDVREPHEHVAFNIQGLLIPLAELQHRMNEIPYDKPIVIYCRSGKRSEAAVKILNSHGYTNVKNLEGGMLAWQHDIAGYSASLIGK
jgi:rhodanese-related sulfurtransferase